MSEPKFTKGPWAFEGPNEDTESIWITAKGDSGLATIKPCDRSDGKGETINDQDRANAHLIAAAPELYEALEFLCRGRKGIDVKQARIVLAKARGDHA